MAQNLSKKGMYIKGDYGTGKTHIAVAIAHMKLTEGIPTMFKTGFDMLQDIRNSYETGNDVLDAYKKIDVLIIDDLGKEQATEWAQSQLWAIINERYERELLTIITSNHTMNNLAKKLAGRGETTTAESIIDRLREMMDNVTMHGESRRK